MHPEVSSRGQVLEWSTRFRYGRGGVRWRSKRLKDGDAERLGDSRAGDLRHVCPQMRSYARPPTALTRRRDSGRLNEFGRDMCLNSLLRGA